MRLRIGSLFSSTNMHSFVTPFTYFERPTLKMKTRLCRFTHLFFYLFVYFNFRFLMTIWMHTETTMLCLLLLLLLHSQVEAKERICLCVMVCLFDWNAVHCGSIDYDDYTIPWHFFSLFSISFNWRKSVPNGNVWLEVSDWKRKQFVSNQNSSIFSFRLSGISWFCFSFFGLAAKTTQSIFYRSNKQQNHEQGNPWHLATECNASELNDCTCAECSSVQCNVFVVAVVYDACG